MQKRSFETKIYLQKLRKSVTQHTMCVEAFIDVPNALWTLVGYLTGTDSQLQLEAAWCITNMCASNHKHTKTIIRAAAPYLITYLSSDNEMLQDHCAWALGNMAGDSKECRDLLKVQGIVHPLVKLLTVSSPGSLGRLPNHVCNEKHPINVFFQTLDPPPPQEIYTALNYKNRCLPKLQYFDVDRGNRVSQRLALVFNSNTAHIIQSKKQGGIIPWKHYQAGSE